jgi:hypothetical protein
VPQYLNIRPVEQYISGSIVNAVLGLSSVISNSEFYSGTILSNISVHSVSLPIGNCIGTGDPHYTTFDGYYWHIYWAGTYVLSKSNTRDFEVQVRTIGYPAQHCGFAVRENGDVVVVNACSGSISLRRSCATIQCLYGSGSGSGYGSGSSISSSAFPRISTSGNTYTATMASGSIVQLSYYTSYQGNIQLTLVGIDRGNVNGVCGNFNSNSADDQPSTLSGNVCTSSNQLPIAYIPSYDLFAYVPVPNMSNNMNPVSVSASCTYNASAITYPTITYGSAEDITNIITHSILLTAIQDPNTVPINTISYDNTSTNAVNASTIFTYCTNGLINNFQDCQKLTNVNVTMYIKNCIDDATFGTDLQTSLLIASQAYQLDCIHQVSINVSLWNNSVVDSLCPSKTNQTCSGHGTCASGACICNDTYTGFDCGISKFNKPVISYVSPTIINADNLNATTLAITGIDFQLPESPNNDSSISSFNAWKCIISDNTDEENTNTITITILAQYLSTWTLTCPLSSLAAYIDNVNKTFGIAVVNQYGNVSNTLSTAINIHSTACVLPLCIIDGKCIISGKINPQNPCQLCTSSFANKWSWNSMPNISQCRPNILQSFDIVVSLPIEGNVLYNFPILNNNEYVSGSLKYTMSPNIYGLSVTDYGQLNINRSMFNSIIDTQVIQIPITITDIRNVSVSSNVTLIFQTMPNINVIINASISAYNWKNNDNKLNCPSVFLDQCIAYGLYNEKEYNCIKVNSDNGNILINSEDSRYIYENITLPAYVVLMNGTIFSTTISLSYIGVSTFSSISIPIPNSTPQESTYTYTSTSTSTSTTASTSTSTSTSTTSTSTTASTYTSTTSTLYLESLPTFMYVHLVPIGINVNSSAIKNQVIYTYNYTKINENTIVSYQPYDLPFVVNNIGEVSLTRDMTINDIGNYTIIIFVITQHNNYTMDVLIHIYLDPSGDISTPVSKSTSGTVSYIAIIVCMCAIFAFIILFIIRRNKSKSKIQSINGIPVVDLEFVNPIYMSYYRDNLSSSGAEEYLYSHPENEFIVYNNEITPEWHNLAIKTNGYIVHEKIWQHYENDQMVFTLIGDGRLVDISYDSLSKLVSEYIINHTTYDNINLKNYPLYSEPSYNKDHIDQ